VALLIVVFAIEEARLANDLAISERGSTKGTGIERQAREGAQ
jgi:hypothetical protein